MFPATTLDRQKGPGRLTLQAVNGTSISTYGERSITVDLGTRRVYRWIFILAGSPLIGAINLGVMLFEFYMLSRRERERERERESFYVTL